MNAQLIQDEGHRNQMDLIQLTKRMRAFLDADYEAVIFTSNVPVGYALFRYEPDYVYLRQFYIASEFRRRGFGRQGVKYLREQVWQDQKRLRLDVLVQNEVGLLFWHNLGLETYSLTLEMEFTE